MPARSVLLPLQQLRGVWSPITLPIVGTYNRSGSIAGIEENANTDRILEYFSIKRATNDFVVDEGYLRDFGLAPVNTIERLLGAFQCNVHDKGLRRADCGSTSRLFHGVAASVNVRSSDGAPAGMSTR